MSRNCYVQASICFFVGVSCPIASGQRAGHGVHPPMPDARLCAHVRAIDSSSSAFSDVALKIRSVSAAEKLDQPIVSAGSNAAIRVVRYLPSAELEQNVFADGRGVGPPAIELAIEGPSQSMRRWLLADDPDRNRLISYIGTWRFMAVPDETQRKVLFEQFRTEQTHAPTIRITASGREAWRDLPLDIGRTQVVPELGCTVTIRQFLPDYAMDRTTLTPVSLSDRKKNPAALVEIGHEGMKEANWVFSKFPDFAHSGGNKLPFRVILDCPIETDGNTPDIAIVAVGPNHEVWIRKDGKTTPAPIETHTKAAIPGSQYTFRIVRHVPNARLEETYHPVEHGKGKPALEIAYSDEKGETARAWLGMGHYKRVVTQAGAFLVGLGDCGGSPVQGHP